MHVHAHDIIRLLHVYPHEWPSGILPFQHSKVQTQHLVQHCHRSGMHADASQVWTVTVVLSLTGE